MRYYPYEPYFPPYRSFDPEPFFPRDTWRAPRPDAPSPFNPRDSRDDFRGAAPAAEGLSEREIEIVRHASRGACGGDHGGIGRGAAAAPLSPDAFASVGSVLADESPWNLSPMVFTELKGCARGLQEVARDLREAATKDARHAALLDASSRCFYAVGLLHGQGIVIPQDLPVRGRGADETPTRASNACERFGRELDRLLGTRGTRAGFFESIGRLADPAKECFRGLALYDVEHGEPAVV